MVHDREEFRRNFEVLKHPQRSAWTEAGDLLELSQEKLYKKNEWMKGNARRETMEVTKRSIFNGDVRWDKLSYHA